LEEKIKSTSNRITMRITENRQAPDRLDFLDNLKAIAIFMVVGIHAAAYVTQLTDSQRLIISYVIHSAAVPIFFMVDGFLFAKNREGKSSFLYWDYIRKSLRRLVVPWLIFTLAYTVMRYILERLSFFQDSYIVGQSFVDVVKSAYGAVYSAQLYFLLSLFFIRLTTPIICKLLDAINGIGWFVLYLICALVYKTVGPQIQEYLYIDGGQEPLTHAIWGIQFYIFGIVLYKFLIRVNHTLLFSALGLMALISLLQSYLPFGIYEVERMLYVSCIFSFCYLYGKYFGFIRSVGQQSMGIYLLHVPLILKALSIILQRSDLLPIIQFFTLTITGFAISYLLTLLINRVGLGVVFGSK
jgi:surface polysaccharide O-acyltransferase-like enzyme